MDAERFDSLIWSLSVATSRRGAWRLLAGSGLGGLLATGTLSTVAGKRGTRKGKGKRRGKDGQKVTICHNGQTTRIAKPALKRHLRHGDTRGKCQTPSPPPLDCGCNALQTCVNPQTKTCVTGSGTCSAGVSGCAGTGDPSEWVCASTEALLGVQACNCIESASGETRCTREELIGGGCNQDACTTDTECQSRFPAVPGAFCAKSGNCCAGKQICMAPCPNA
jgi:hypothetical protein